MASSKSLVSTVLLAAIFFFSLKVNASRELNEQTHNNKVSNGPENEDKTSAGLKFSIGHNNNGGDTIPYPSTGGYLPGNELPGSECYLPGNVYPGMAGYLPGYPYFGGYNGGLPFFGNGPRNFGSFPRGGYNGNIGGGSGLGNYGGYP
ncbi:heterogeneous nuclear ribonucleoprotein A3-like [Dioscorea cayenensis subsp. rotundata]|uniref:Heterogeneous nuclear ribonucleoprotein A3-like n=1 Tax=Dioscorea cayennensis subsp. rotundata TaxID=55577 RepID=A0AB40AYS2_DIOCR|nr:heterogeneous nuclear ribonucleoprotein A3-like [Dioscorea cayenensis subsp. rotundata]